MVEGITRTATIKKQHEHFSKCDEEGAKETKGPARGLFDNDAIQIEDDVDPCPRGCIKNEELNEKKP
jgi:hypothetical protein